MFRLEKVFQNDDKFFIFNSNLIKCLSIFIMFYLFSILEKNSIYEVSIIKSIEIQIILFFQF